MEYNNLRLTCRSLSVTKKGLIPGLGLERKRGGIESGETTIGFVFLYRRKIVSVKWLSLRDFFFQKAGQKKNYALDERRFIVDLFRE